MVEVGDKGDPSWASTVIRNPVVCALIPAIAKGTSDEIPVFKAPAKCQLTKCGIVPEDAITGADTNYFTLYFYDKDSGGASSNNIVSKAFTAGVNVTNFDFCDFGTLSAHKGLASGDVVSFAKSETGSGMAMSRLLAVLEYELIL